MSERRAPWLMLCRVLWPMVNLNSNAQCSPATDAVQLYDRAPLLSSYGVLADADGGRATASEARGLTLKRIFIGRQSGLDHADGSLFPSPTTAATTDRDGGALIHNTVHQHGNKATLQHDQNRLTLPRHTRMEHHHYHSSRTAVSSQF
eukprot:scaffold1837_cov192-Alexandrium_tamarense.AAC.2